MDFPSFKQQEELPQSASTLKLMFKTPFSTWEPQWSETEHEVLRDFGHAAMAAQMLEAALVQILLAGEYAGRISFNKNSDIETELSLSKRTFGQLIKELKRGGIDEQSAEMLKDALEARNFLMHHFFPWHSEDFITDVVRGKILRELQKIRFRIGRTQMVFEQIRKHIFKEVY